MHRTSREVAVQAIIGGVLGFRASLEVTQHPRSENLCRQILPWLEQLGLANEIGPLYREILEIQHRELSQQARATAFWQGETALFLGWAVRLFDKPHPVETVD